MDDPAIWPACFGVCLTLAVLTAIAAGRRIRALDRARRQAEAANAAKSRFLAHMSHELRTPLNAILGMSDAILEASADPLIRGRAGDIQSAAQDLLAIVNDILDLSRVEAGRMELECADYCPKTLAGAAAGMMGPAAARRGLALQYECDGTLPCRCNGDTGKLKRILINLLGNAVKFTREGHVRLSVTGEPAGEDCALITFRVEDTGCGIREEDLERIFEDFHRAEGSRDTEGAGLGLAIVKDLVELMNGVIRVESVYGEGTAVTVTVPQKIVDRRPIAEAPEAPRTEPERPETFSAPGVGVLVVDDDPVGRRVTVNLLKKYAFRIDEAESGPRAIELARQNRYDLIFMDHRMSGMDGVQAADIIRRDRGENVPVIIALTADAMEGTRRRFLDLDFRDLITKPLDARELDRLLKRWVPEERRQAADGGETHSPPDPGAFRIEGVDTDAAMRRCSGGEADFAGLLELYCLDGQRRLPFLRELAASDLSRYQTEVHALKSASADIGAAAVSDMARAQEDAAARGDRDLIDRQLPMLLEAYGALLEEIGRALERRQNAPAGEKLPPLSAREVREQVGAALGELENFRSRAAAGIVEDLLGRELPRDTADSLGEIRGQLRLYEDDNAEMLLRQLLNRLETEG